MLALAALAAAMPAAAQRYRLDDSLSPVQTYGVSLEWSTTELRRALAALVSGGPEALPALTGQVNGVKVRLNTRAFVGQRARIYLVLPLAASGVTSPADLELRGQTLGGEMLDGTTRPGQSALVYEGVIAEPVLQSVFNFLMIMENGADADAFTLEPFYELEVLP